MCEERNPYMVQDLNTNLGHSRATKNSIYVVLDLPKSTNIEIISRALIISGSSFQLYVLHDTIRE